MNIFNCWPNPFTGRTTFRFSSVESGATEVSVVNILGREVSRIFTGMLDAGAHTFLWDAHDLPAGVYTCVLHAKGQVKQLPV